MAPKVSIIHHKLARMSSFASCWRYGNVTPLSKSGSPSSIPSQYRPISITPFLSKVFEQLLAKHLNAYVETDDLFPSLQFGFRKGLGTCDALLTITSAVWKSLDTGCSVCMIVPDYSSAFDRVNQPGQSWGSYLQTEADGYWCSWSSVFFFFFFFFIYILVTCGLVWKIDLWYLQMMLLFLYQSLLHIWGLLLLNHWIEIWLKSVPGVNCRVSKWTLLKLSVWRWVDQKPHFHHILILLLTMYH